MTNIKEDIPTDLQYPHSTEPAQTQTPASTIPLEPIEQVESSIPESFHIHYAGLKSKQKVIRQLQALATLLEEESLEQYQFSIQIHTASQK
ncbi:hypothetical protein [Bacillus thuringiensis]|uniref:hypothetical protein n=1 Tax=Bacillus thuringiensis TaxID=1428 RepID=UPI00211D8CF0|nr:hypothetical protein [Bacillus thuringiensis]